MRGFSILAFESSGPITVAFVRVLKVISTLKSVLIFPSGSACLVVANKVWFNGRVNVILLSVLSAVSVNIYAPVSSEAP